MKFNLGDAVIFDGNRKGKIVGFEIMNTVKGKDFNTPNYPGWENNTNIRYQIMPTDNGERLYGSMRSEKELTKIS